MPTFFEFFAGGGMARAALTGWDCLFANDLDAKKAESYRRNWGGGHLRLADVGTLTLDDLPPVAPDLVWASFPCQDLSLAGKGGGLDAGRSGTFWAFWRLMRRMVEAGRRPRVIALENVCGLITSRGGRDFAALCETLAQDGYQVGAMVLDAQAFVPQSRPRLFVVAADLAANTEGLVVAAPDPSIHPASLMSAVEGLSGPARDAWRWWRLPAPPARRAALADLIETSPNDVGWHAPEQTARLLEMMAPLHRARVEAAVTSGGRAFGALYRRTRRDPDGRKVQRAEVRFDGVAGCLRTPAGGSSRQVLVIIEDGRVRSRLMSGREAARLMGLGDDYQLPARHNEACKLMGDGVAVPVVAHLARHLLEPLSGVARAHEAA